MAQAQYDKFIALRKSGTDATTARKQAYGDIPVAPVPVAPTPTTPTQTIQGVNGEAFQVAPTNAQGLSTPAQTPTPVQAQVTPPETTVASAVTPTPTPEVAPTPLDKTTEIKAQNEAQMALNKQKSELAIQDRKQAEADAKLASTPTDEKGVLNAFMTGASVPKQNTQAFRNAEFKYNNFKKFSTMTPTQLLDNMKMGEIGTETATLLAQNPNYIKAKEEFDKFQKSQSINNMMKSVVGGATGKTQEVDHYNKAQSDVAKKLGINETNAEAFARIVGGNQLVQTLTKTVSDTAKQLNTLNTERNAVYADLKKQYPDMSASAIMTLMGTRTKETTDQINALNSTLTLTQADLKDAMTMAQAEYGATQADITLQADITKEQRTIDNAIALSQAQFDQKIAQQAQAMNDPVQAINSVIDQYAKEGIMASISPQEHIQRAKALIAKGGTLGEYISQMQKDFQSKPEYKAKFTGNLNDTQKMQMAYEQDIAKIKLQNSMKDKNIQRVGGTTDNPIYGYIDGDKIVTVNVPGSPTATGGTVIPPTPEAIKSISSRLTGNKLQCGMPVNDYNEKVFPGASHIDDTYESKVKAVESIGVSDVPQVGGIFALNTYNSNGHTGIVQSVDLANGTFTATDANSKPPYNGGPLETNTYPISKNFTFSQGPQVAEIGQSDIVAYNGATPTEKAKILKTQAGKQITEQRNNVFKDPNADINDILSYSQGGKTINQTSEGQLYKFSQALNQVGDLQKEISSADTGPILGILRSNNPYDTKAQSIKAQLSALLPNLARGVYGEVGVLTDNDIANYSRTVPNLKSTTDVNNAILAMTLKGIANGYKSKLQSLASAGYDVSGYEGIYSNIQSTVDGLMNTSNSPQNSSNPTNIPPAIYSSFESDYNDL